MTRSLRRSLIAAPLAAAAAAMLPATAFANFPDRPIELIVPWPAGQENDVLGRALATSMSKRLGVPVQVINKPGAGGVTGTSEFIRAKPDGHTIGLISVGPALTQSIAGNAPYQPTDMQPIALVTASAFVLAAKADGPFKSLADVEARSKDGKPPVLANFGPAAVPTQVVYRMAKARNWQFKPVTFPGAGWAQLASGDAELVTAPYNTIAGQLKSGQARALAVFGKERIEGLDAPTLREAGYGFDALVWSGMFAPKGTPAPVLDRLAKALAESLKDPEVVELSKKMAIPLFNMDAQQAAEQIKADESALRPQMEALGLVKK